MGDDVAAPADGLRFSAVLPYLGITMLLRAALFASSGLVLSGLSALRGFSASAGSGTSSERIISSAAAPDTVSRLQGPAAVVERHQLSARGRVLLPDDGTPLGLRAFATTGGHVDSADVDIAGGFVIPLPDAGCDSVDIRIDVIGDRPRRYHAAHLRIPSPRRADTTAVEAVRVILVPTAFTIEGGSYAGAIIPITIDYAIAAPDERSRYWRVSRSRYGYGVPIGWPTERFPIPLAVNGRTGPLRTADSAAFWAIARRLEHDIGRTLFRPSPFDSARSEGWSVTVSLNPAEDTPGVTFITYDGRGDLFDATVVFRMSVLLADERVVTHELLHALGFGHVVGWHSVMSTAYQTVARATATDIAYAQLFYRMRRMHVEQRATHGILSSTADARRPLGDGNGPRCALEPPGQ